MSLNVVAEMQIYAPDGTKATMPDGDVIGVNSHVTFEDLVGWLKPKYPLLTGFKNRDTGEAVDPAV